MPISVTANGVSVMPELDPGSDTPEAYALYVAVAEVLFARATEGTGTRLTISASGGRIDTVVPAGAVIQMITDSEIVTEDSPHFRDVLVERLRAHHEALAATTGRIDINLYDA